MTISWGKGGWCVRLTTYHHPVPLSRNLGTLTSWNPLGLSRPVMGLIYIYLLQRKNIFTRLFTFRYVAKFKKLVLNYGVSAIFNFVSNFLIIFSQ